MSAGFNSRRVENPTSEMSAGIKNSSRSDHVPACQVSEVGTDGASCRSTGNGMADNAGSIHENFLSMFLNVSGRSFCGLALGGQPALEMFGSFGNDLETHMCVLQS